MNKKMSLTSIQDGSKALLIDAVSVLKNFPNSEYIVIGGWCPYLRNTTSFSHFGTLDVDLLFKDSYFNSGIKNVMEGFLDAGFIPSAKHPFQLLKSQKIQGKDFIYNVDFLHPNMIIEDEMVGMFVDHLDFDIPISDNENNEEVKAMMSIVLPNSTILFSENLFSEEIINSIRFNLINFDGMFITKMDSCQKQKRERDSFDIFIGFSMEDGGIDIHKIHSLAQKDEKIKESLSKFVNYLKNEKNKEIFDNNVKKFSKNLTSSPSNLILQKIEKSELSA